jgi:hypothetical protein
MAELLLTAQEPHARHETFGLGRANMPAEGRRLASVKKLDGSFHAAATVKRPDRCRPTPDVVMERFNVQVGRKRPDEWSG